MIVDCHTQIWEPHKLPRWVQSAFGAVVPADTNRHLEAVEPIDRAIVLAFKSVFLQSEIPNRYVADYCRRNSSKLIGFAGVDPTAHDYIADLRSSQEELGLKGVVISPALQNFHPVDTRAMRLYEECVNRGMPVVFEENHRFDGARMEFARPMLLDEVAREFPELRIVITHMGYPWVDETIVMLAKHPNVYANVAGLLKQQWLAYNALVSAFQNGVIDKLLFGSDFPYRSPAACIETLYSLNQMTHGTNLPTIPREHLRGIVERDSLALLGVERRSRNGLQTAALEFNDED